MVLQNLDGSWRRKAENVDEGALDQVLEVVKNLRCKVTIENQKILQNAPGGRKMGKEKKQEV